MQDFDTILKQLLADPNGRALEYITGHRIVSWRNVEMPATRNLRADSVGRDEASALVQIECQTRNDPKMAVRMLNYGAWLVDDEGEFPFQYVLYIGSAPVTMPDALRTRGVDYSYVLVDVRELDGEPLLDSPDLRDNILAVLMRLRDRRDAVRRIVARIAELDEADRRTAYKQLLTLAGLRQLGTTVKEEGKKMFVIEDYLEHDVFGPLVRQGLEQGIEEGIERGLKQGRAEGREEGRVEGEHTAALGFLCMIVERLGPIPPVLMHRYATLSTAQIREESKRALAATASDELL
jgi:hypothetical protein